MSSAVLASLYHRTMVGPRQFAREHAAISADVGTPTRVMANQSDQFRQQPKATEPTFSERVTAASSDLHLSILANSSCWMTSSCSAIDVCPLRISARSMSSFLANFTYTKDKGIDSVGPTKYSETKVRDGCFAAATTNHLLPLEAITMCGNGHLPRKRRIYCTAVVTYKY